jgi:hypothetical protein
VGWLSAGLVTFWHGGIGGRRLSVRASGLVVLARRVEVLAYRRLHGAVGFLAGRRVLGVGWPARGIGLRGLAGCRSSGSRGATRSVSGLGVGRCSGARLGEIGFWQRDLGKQRGRERGMAGWARCVREKKGERDKQGGGGGQQGGGRGHVR